MNTEKEEKRVLSINPTDFHFSNNNTKKKKEPIESKSKSKIKIKSNVAKPKQKSDTLRKQSILKLIRQQQQQRYDKMFDNKPKENLVVDTPIPHVQSTNTNMNVNNDFESDFDKAKEYMMKLSEQQNTRITTRPHNQTLKQQPILQSQINNVHANNHLHQPNNNIVPQYGCLKNGNLPTLRNRTASNRPLIHIGESTNINNIPPIPTSNMNSTIPPNSFTGNTNILSETQPIINSSHSNNHISNAYKTSLNRAVDLKMNSVHLHKPRPKKKYQKKTLKRRYDVGKSSKKPVVSVLISNKTIRNNITTKSQLMKQTPIRDVKRYLIKQGFIKVGSTTPNDILRKMYETSQLICGEVQNHNQDNLLFNFLNNNDDEE